MTAHHFLRRLFSGSKDDCKFPLSYQDASTRDATSPERSYASLSTPSQVQSSPNEILGCLRKRSNTHKCVPDPTVDFRQYPTTTIANLGDPRAFAPDYVSVGHAPSRPNSAIVCHSPDAPSFSRGRRKRFSPLSNKCNLPNSQEADEFFDTTVKHALKVEEATRKVDRRHESSTDPQDDEEVYEIIKRVNY